MTEVTAPKRARRLPYFKRQPSLRKAMLKAAEQKAAAFAITTQHMDTTGEVRLITAPAEGSDANERVGKKCIVNKVLLNLKIMPSASTATTTNPPVYQWWLVYDKHPNGALPTLNQIVVGTQGSRIALPAGEYRFQILAKGYGYIFNDATKTQGENICHMVEKSVRVNKKMIFTGDTGEIASISEGAFYLVTEGDTVNANPHPVAVGEACLYFKDL